MELVADRAQDSKSSSLAHKLTILPYNLPKGLSDTAAIFPISIPAVFHPQTLLSGTEVGTIQPGAHLRPPKSPTLTTAGGTQESTAGSFFN